MSPSRLGVIALRVRTSSLGVTSVLNMLKSSRLFFPALHNYHCQFLPFSSSSPSRNVSIKVCIMGSGPAGFYFAQNILKKIPDVSVDVYDKLPVPFGLVRYGVAPDHPEVKNVISTFEKTASHPKFRFVGNVTLGQDVKFSELKEAYHAVVLTYGCSSDREVGVPGENLTNVISARKFVGWYNGLPEDRNLPVDLSVDSVVVLGQGNVAVDVSRILLSPIDSLKGTDITDYSLEALSRSKVKTVYMVGRRGPLQAAFTIKEFREMTKLPNVQTVFDTSHFEGTQDIIPTLPRARKRLTELMTSTMKAEQKGDKFFRPIFLHRPAEISSSSNGSAAAVKFELNRIDHTKGVPEGVGKYSSLDCGLVLRSIGYKGTSPDKDIPFDSSSGTVINGNGVYSAGWIHTGPTGVILSTMTDAFEQSNNLIEDFKQGRLDAGTKEGFPAIESILKSKGVVTVDFNGWKRIDKEEVRRGSAAGKPREKIVDINEMVSIGGS